MTALEALALGKSLIAHNTGGLKDILQAYPELLVSQHSAQGYCEKVQNLLANVAQPITLPERYTAEKNMLDTMNLYQKLT